MRKPSKKALAVLTTAALLSGGGAAFAYWTTTGNGNGTAANAGSNGVVVLHATFAAGLAPGGSESVAYTADNGGTSDLFVTALTTPVVTTSIAGCLPSDFTATANATGSGTLVLHSSTGTAVGSGTLTFANSLVTQDACKNAVVTLTLSST